MGGSAGEGGLAGWRCDRLELRGLASRLYKPALAGQQARRGSGLALEEDRMQATRVAVDTFDHFAYPVEALVEAERFYTEVLEMPIFERRGLRVADVIRGTLPRTFMDVAGHRIGLFLGREELPPAAGLDGCPNVGLEITAAGLRRVAARLPGAGVPFRGPAPRAGVGPEAASVRLQDPWG